MQCDVSALLLPDSESDALRVSLLHNPDARGPFREGSLVPMNSSISGQVLRKAKSIRIDSFEQVREDPEVYGNPDGQLLYERVIEEGLRTGCYLPLIGRDRVVGVLMLCRRSDNSFKEDDITLLEQVACQVAIAVENTLEYEKATTDRDKEAKRGNKLLDSTTLLSYYLAHGERHEPRTKEFARGHSLLLESR